MDLDSLDDIFSVGTTKNARAVGKFQPKSKRKPGKESYSVTFASPVQINDVELKLDNSITIAEPSDHTSVLFDKVAAVDVPKVSDNSHSDLHDVPNDGGGWDPCIENSVGDSVGMYIELESLNDFLPSTAADTGETIDIIASDYQCGEGPILTVSSLDDPVKTGKPVDTSCRFTDGETNIASCGRVGQLDDLQQEIEETDIMETDYASKLVIIPEEGTAKFGLQPEMQLRKEIRPENTDTGSCAVDSMRTPFEVSISHKESVTSSGQENTPDISSIEEFNCIVHTDTASELLIDESLSFTEMNHIVSNIQLECDTEVPAKLVSRRAKTRTNKMPSTSDTFQLPENILTEQGRSLRPRKNKENQCEQVNESENEVLSGEELSDNAVLENLNINDQDYQVENDSPTKNAKKRKPKNSAAEKEKVAVKRKRVVSEQDAAPKQKKFSHSTRRRKVDKVLLETPEDEIDYPNVPIRDLLLLAAHKERQLRKEESTSVASSSKQSNHNSSEFFNQDDNDGHSSPFVDESSICYNYQTYMDRTPVTRWSKQDTELFYEAVQQFGTDLSLIQQLFPGRTRRQVKLKYKKEERQHPMRLRDALTSRSKDHSHFEKVIEHLNRIAVEERVNADKDGSTEIRDDDVVEDIPDINDEEANTEQNEEKETEEHAEQELGEDASPLKLYDSEDDLFKWSQYRTD